jgi:thiamine transport system substrate-binding protein
MDSATTLKLSAAALLLTSAMTVVASDKPVLNVYTYDSFVSEWGPGPQLKTAFEAQCGCTLNFVAAEDGVSILNRARVEKSNTQADVLLGLDNGLMTEATQLGLVQTHSVDTSKITSDLNWSNNQFVPFDYGYFAFIYDAEKIKAPATSFAELLASDASVIYQDPRTSTPGQGLMTWVNKVYGVESATAWADLAKQTVTVTKGWWEAYSLFLEGGSDYVLSYTTSPAYHVVAEGKDQYKAAEFTDGHVAQVEVAAISAYSDQTELANQFLEFLISNQAQQILPVTNWMLPVIDNVELPEAFEQLVTPQQIKLGSDELAENRARWIREWRTAVSQ